MTTAVFGFRFGKRALALWAVLGGAYAAGCGEESGDPRHREPGQLEQGLPKGAPGAANGQLDFCTGGTACTQGEGDCDADSECAPGLVCGYDNLERFLPGACSGCDACVLSHCRDGIQNAGETGTDCGGADCGACLTCPVTPNGAVDHCTTNCPCPAGEGDCDVNADCAAGLVCGQTLGPQFQMPHGHGVCVAQHCADRTQNADETGIDCGGADCGSCTVCPTTPGPNTCSPTCRCPAGLGDCDADRECQPGLVCTTGISSQFGISNAFQVCAPAHCSNGALDAARGETGIDCGGPCGQCLGGPPDGGSGAGGGGAGGTSDGGTDSSAGTSGGGTGGTTPIATQQAKLVASDGLFGDFFGNDVSVSGDTALVGANGDDLDIETNVNQGSAYVFVRNGTTWTAQAKLTASDGAAADAFGGGVSVSGDTALVGAPGDDIFLESQGSAYVFKRTGTTWSQQEKLVATDGAALAGFGYSVRVSGDTAIVGAPFHDVSTSSRQGAAYVFVRTGTAWSQQAKLTASDGNSNDYLGLPVTVDGNTAVIGAHGADVGANLFQGAAYVFVRNGTTWSQQAKLVASDGSASDICGWSASLSGDTAVVGCYNDDVGRGSVYVFSRSGTTWSQQAKLVANDGAPGDWFGVSVSISGATMVVGAHGADVAGKADQGAAYLFLREGSSWSQRAKLTASDGAAGAGFGSVLTVAGNTLLVGLPNDDRDGDENQGSAYVFLLH